jgi:site-specific recombinase XerD
MSKRPISLLRQRMIDDMTARHLGPHTQHDYIRSCKRFAAFLARSPETATADDIRRFQLDLAESGISIGNRNAIVTGVKFLFRVTLRRHDLAAEFYAVRYPRKIALVMSPDEIERLLAAAKTLRLRVMLSLAYGCGLRIGEVVRLKVGDIDSAERTFSVSDKRSHPISSASSSPKGVRTAMSCCRRRCLSSFGNGGASARQNTMRVRRNSRGYCFRAGNPPI